MTHYVVLLAAAGTLATFAQTERFEVRVPALGPADGVRAHAVEFVHHEFGAGGQVVKNTPYSAEAVIETVQTLSDGNRIVRRNSSQIARDSEGRTRRDAALAPLGPLTGADVPKTSFIHDPVSNTSVTLDHNTKTARKMQGRGFMVHAAATPGARIQEDMVIARPAGGALAVGPEPTMIRLRSKSPGKEESLGKRNIEGVMAEGTRSVEVIPAGEIGNERPIEIVFERWFSPELQAMVMTKHSDPRIGETTYKLTNIQRSEPSKSLFEIPPDYTVKEAELPNIRMLRERIEKAKE